MKNEKGEKIVEIDEGEKDDVDKEVEDEKDEFKIG